MRILLLFALGAALLLTGGARADNYDDPKALVAALYDPYTHGQQPANLAAFYSDGLKLLFARHLQQAQYSGGIGAGVDVAAAKQPEFDPFVNAKRYLLLDLRIGDPVIDGDRAIVDVSYKNFDHPSVLTISLVRNPEGWKVDDVASLGADDHWLLSWLLTYDPTGVH
ncbi:MAG: hypothetical protein P4M09_01940 [Devosia sp.]|nr:hypothetical protein [Devosia sp.]